MSRYIDADALIDDCNGVLEHEWNYKVAPNSWADAYELFKETLENAPTVNVLAIENLKARGRLAAVRYQLERIYNGEICGTCDTIPFGQGDVCVKCLRHHIGKLIGKEKSDEM